MNRKERRRAAKEDSDRARKVSPTPIESVAPVVAKAEKAGLGLRMAAGILLSSWVLKRVDHHAILVTLADLAQQTGRLDALMYIQQKLGK